jgi:prolyl-tRNA editing enzyme YbaK/EbsC (Cys-tRNA(Pro) deacylase)
MEKQMKKESKASKIMKYIATHPKDKATEVAKALNVNVNSVYQATYLAKKKAKTKPKSKWKAVAVSTSNKSVFQKPSTLAPNAVMSMALHADMVNHPSHYKVGGIETIDFIEAKNLGYNLGNVVKYITRADFKGNKLEDLQKAQWYLNREVSKLKGSK